jgi:hypothetical protein
MLGIAAAVVSLGQHPTVQVATGHACDAPMVSGIDKIGTDFKGCDPQPPGPQRRHYAEGNGGFSATALGPGDDDTSCHKITFSVAI